MSKLKQNSSLTRLNDILESTKELVTRVEDGKINVSLENRDNKSELDSDMFYRNSDNTIKIPTLKEKINRSKSSEKSANNILTKDKKSNSIKLSNKLNK